MSSNSGINKGVFSRQIKYNKYQTYIVTNGFDVFVLLTFFVMLCFPAPFMSDMLLFTVVTRGRQICWFKKRQLAANMKTNFYLDFKSNLINNMDHMRISGTK